MSLNASRTELMEALETAGIETYYGWGAFSAPCARIFPGEPWVGLSDGGLGGKRVQRWEIWAVAGAVDSSATFDDLEKLVQDINTCMEGLQVWTHMEWRRPSLTDMGGMRYIACRGVIQTMMEV
jgi:hypothetical protein